MPCNGSKRECEVVRPYVTPFTIISPPRVDVIQREGIELVWQVPLTPKVTFTPQEETLGIDSEEVGGTGSVRGGMPCVGDGSMTSGG